MAPSFSAQLRSELEEKLPKALSEIERLEAEKAGIDEEIRNLRAFVRMINPPERKQGQTRKGSSPVITRPATLLPYAEAMLKINTERFGVDDVAVRVGKTTDAVRHSIKPLRDMQFIAAAGTEKVNKGRRGTARRNLYTILDRHVIETLREQANAAA